MAALIREKKWSHSFDFVVGVNCPAFNSQCTHPTFLTPQSVEQIGELLTNKNGYGYLALLSSSLGSAPGYPPYEQTLNTYFCLPDQQGTQLIKAIEMKLNGFKPFSIVNKQVKFVGL